MSVLLLSVIYGLIIVILILVLGVHPQLSSHSQFELKRRARQGDEEAKLLLKRRTYLADLFSLQRVITALLLVSLSVIGVELFHWLVGFLVSLVIALYSGVVARLSPLQKISQRIYERYEGAIIRCIEKYSVIFWAIRSVVPSQSSELDVESREELLEIVKNAGDALSKDEKKLITNSLKFKDMKVADAMIPRTMIDSIGKDEVLGPIVLDGLYQTGHSRFPVIDGDIDHVVGMLYVQDLVTIGNAKKSQKAHHVTDAMEYAVFYIREDQSLQQALAAFIKTRHHLFIVINQYRETVGLLSLEDALEALLGKKINDEFDTHEDLRKVAEHNPRGNNSPKTTETI